MFQLDTALNRNNTCSLFLFSVIPIDGVFPKAGASSTH
jgi:hypothetical protein